MSQFPDFLLKLNQTDQQQTQLEHVRFYASSNAASQEVDTVGSGYIVPAGRILILTNAVAEGYTPSTGLAQTDFPVSAIVGKVSSGIGAPAKKLYLAEQTWRVANNNTTNGDRAYLACTLPTQAYVFEGEEVFGECLFLDGTGGSGGKNYVSLHMCGILIPRGNFVV